MNSGNTEEGKKKGMKCTSLQPKVRSFKYAIVREERRQKEDTAKEQQPHGGKERVEIGDLVDRSGRRTTKKPP